MATRRRRRTVKVQRGDAAEVIEHETSENVEGQLLELREPQFLSIVKAPANRTPFKIVRDEGTQRRRRRTQDDALLSVTLPSDISTEDAEIIFDRFGLSRDEYDITTAEDGSVTYNRKKKTGDEETVPINLGNGVIAHVEAGALQRGMPSVEDHPGLTVLRLDFDALSDDPRGFAAKWMDEHQIDREIGGWLDESNTFCRHEAEPPEDAVTVKLEGGVVATVAQTREDDVPVRIYRQVIEELYGYYGFGMVDFNQAMANEIFTRDAREANYLLWDILDNILFYSELPLADRQALVMNALNQFAVWLSNLMAALPRQMTEPNATVDLNSQGTSDDNAARSENDPSEETKETADMSKDKEQKAQGAEDQETVERQETSDDSSTETSATETETVERTETETTAEVEDTEKVFTRTEAEEIAASAVTSALEKKEQAKREDEAPATATAVADAVTAALAPVVQRMEKVDARLEEMETATVAREDTDDADQGGNTEGETEEVQRKDPYRGAFLPGLYGKTAS